MSDETYQIQYLGNTPYLVYQTGDMDDCVVIELTDAQQQAVEEFESREWQERVNFCKSLICTGNQ